MTEKVDGTNIRICFLQRDGQRRQPNFLGRTDAAVIQPCLLPCLQSLATWENIDQAMEGYLSNRRLDITYNELTLFGEGYGPKIQACGGNYRKDTGFILFDVLIDRMWLSRESVALIAQKLNVPSVPLIGSRWTEEQIVEYVKSKPKSLCSQDEQVMEGVVARAGPTVYFSGGNPVMFKLKCKEF